MRVVSAREIDAVLDFPALIDALHSAFRADIETPLRHHHAIARDDGEAALLLMPAWTKEKDGAFLGTKTVTVFPGNLAKNIGSVAGTYLLMSGDTGEPLVTIDGHRLTLWRTAAASALAAKYLAREDASHLLLIGAGALAPYLARAHAAVRPIKKVSIWNRTPERAEVLAKELANETFAVEVVGDRERAARHADIVTCITLSQTPVVSGDWLKEGAHLDLVGAFRPNAREADDAAIRRASIYVDTRRGALKEAGDLVMPMAAGILKEDAVKADLFELCRGQAKGRARADEITLFKSVGTAIEDLAAAMLVWRKLS
ncbi:MAG: ornithine cyclodeaminase family protein [Xanthobacteraceae bacterium]|nr:ornithine cyclodeaminase family protein [Xanthobacteraceae bacterium]QYK45067.1 MAG: ornithine cyclodeaminase family protein [Xanthobacteraceae bacterium]